MYLKNNKLSKDITDSLMLTSSYNYFSEMLFEKSCRLFKWSKLPNNIPQKEIETRLIYYGYCGLVNDKNKGMMIASGGMSGVTQYSDEFTQFTYAAPTARGGTLNIGKDCIIIDNTSLRNPLYPMISRYALLMAHAEVTLKCALVNMRNVHAFSSKDDKTVDNILAWEKKRYNGDIGVILDTTDTGLEMLGESASINNLLSAGKIDGNYVKSIVEVRNEILRMFFSELGVNFSKEKRGNMTEDEINQNNNMLLLNVDDMLLRRQEACDRYNKLNRGNMSVEFSDELKNLKRMEESDNDTE